MVGVGLHRGFQIWVPAFSPVDTGYGLRCPSRRRDGKATVTGAPPSKPRRERLDRCQDHGHARDDVGVFSSHRQCCSVKRQRRQRQWWQCASGCCRYLNHGGGSRSVQPSSRWLRWRRHGKVGEWCVVRRLEAVYTAMEVPLVLSSLPRSRLYVLGFWLNGMNLMRVLFVSTCRSTSRRSCWSRCCRPTGCQVKVSLILLSSSVKEVEIVVRGDLEDRVAPSWMLPKSPSSISNWGNVLSVAQDLVGCGVLVAVGILKCNDC